MPESSKYDPTKDTRRWCENCRFYETPFFPVILRACGCDLCDDCAWEDDHDAKHHA